MSDVSKRQQVFPASPGSEFHGSAQHLSVASGAESVLYPCSAKDGSLDLQQLDFTSKQQKGDFPPIPFTTFLEKIGTISNLSLLSAPLLHKMGTKSYT